jgi:hypothetical protein
LQRFAGSAAVSALKAARMRFPGDTAVVTSTARAPRGLLFRAGPGWCAPRGWAHQMGRGRVVRPEGRGAPRALGVQDWLIEKSVNSNVAGALFVEQISTP